MKQRLQCSDYNLQLWAKYLVIILRNGRELIMQTLAKRIHIPQQTSDISTFFYEKWRNDPHSTVEGTSSNPPNIP